MPLTDFQRITEEDPNALRLASTPEYDNGDESTRAQMAYMAMEEGRNNISGDANSTNGAMVEVQAEAESSAETLSSLKPYPHSGLMNFAMLVHLSIIFVTSLLLILKEFDSDRQHGLYRILLAVTAVPAYFLTIHFIAVNVRHHIAVLCLVVPLILAVVALWKDILIVNQAESVPPEHAQDEYSEISNGAISNLIVVSVGLIWTLASVFGLGCCCTIKPFWHDKILTPNGWR